MSATASVAARFDTARAVPAITPLQSPVLAVALSFALSLAFCWPRLMTVWQAGTFFDPDDAMRLVEVRAWLAGQGWFDLTAHRVDPPTSFFMHWTRVVDVPLALLIRGFELFYPADVAERLTRITFPLIMQVCLLAAIARAGIILAGRNAVLPAVLLTVLSGFMFVQFQPGRIDHDSPEIVLLVMMLGSSLQSLDPAKWRQAAFAALYGAASLAINLEDLPFVVVACAVAPIAWIVRGEAMRPQMIAFALGLAAALSAAFFATVGPARYAIAACDAYSVVHYSAGLGGALICLALAFVVPRSVGMLGRAGFSLAAGVVLLAGFAHTFPACLGDPFNAMDPLLRDLWLNNVTEARPLSKKLLAMRPSAFPVVVLPVVFSTLAMIVAAWRETGVARSRWLVVIGFTAAGIAGCFWEIRASTSLAPVALLGGAYVCARIIDAGKHRLMATLLALVATLPFSAMGWAIAAPIDDVTNDDAVQRDAAACREPDAYKALAALPPGLVFAPIDGGSHILAYTRDTVIAAPYHRNNRGNRMVIDAFLSPPDVARDIIMNSGARYVAYCPGQTQLSVTAARAPDGLAAALLAGRVPSWLTPVGDPTSPYRIFQPR